MFPIFGLAKLCGVGENWVCQDHQFPRLCRT
jgi:hypothetical protein